jgi:hypothetical protein
MNAYIHGMDAVELLRAGKIKHVWVCPSNPRHEWRLGDPTEAAKLVGTHIVRAFIREGTPLHAEIFGGKSTEVNQTEGNR